MVGQGNAIAAADAKQLSGLLKDLLEATDDNPQRGADIRDAVRDAQGELERTGTLTGGVVERIKRAGGAIPGAVDLANKVVALCAKLGIGV